MHSETNILGIKKILILAFTILLLSSCGKQVSKNNIITNPIINNQDSTISQNKSSSGEIIEEKITVVENEQTEINKDKFGDIAEFIKSELTEKESEKLKTILDQRIERQSEIKVMLDDAKENGNLEETLKQVKTMRNSCSSRIIPYIKNTETENFKKYCTQLGDNLTKKYTEK